MSNSVVKRSKYLLGVANLTLSSSQQNIVTKVPHWSKIYYTSLNCKWPIHNSRPSSSVGIASAYGLDSPGIEFWWE
jgi:hypothetical protein